MSATPKENLVFGGSSTSLLNLAEDVKQRPSDWIMNLVTGANPLAQFQR